MLWFWCFRNKWSCEKHPQQLSITLIQKENGAQKLEILYPLVVLDHFHILCLYASLALLLLVWEEVTNFFLFVVSGFPIKIEAPIKETLKASKWKIMARLAIENVYYLCREKYDLGLATIYLFFYAGLDIWFPQKMKLVSHVMKELPSDPQVAARAVVNSSCCSCFS